MAHKIEFTKPDEVNGVKYKKGDTLSVSGSIYARIIANGTVKDFVKPKPKSTKKES